MYTKKIEQDPSTSNYTAAVVLQYDNYKHSMSNQDPDLNSFPKTKRIKSWNDGLLKNDHATEFDE